jgi:L-gulonate 3-dehydrogenase
MARLGRRKINVGGNSTAGESQMKDRKVTIVGAGLIGRAWAAAFARSGMSVAIWSRNEATSDAARKFVHQCLPLLEAEGLLGDRHASDLCDLVVVHPTLEAAVNSADYVQENFPEDVETKRAIYAMLDAVCAPETIIASSASALPASAFTETLAGRGRCIVAHPINPPYLVPATEVVPAPWTMPEVVDGTCEILSDAGQVPVVLKREIDGFVVNRLQGALLNEAFRLVGEGYAGIEDIDTAIKHGLALRWSFMGPFETIDLNAPGGVRDYVERYNALYTSLLSQMQGKSEWAADVLDGVEASRRKHLAMEAHGERQAWRDRRLMALAAHKLEADEYIGR